MPACGASPQPAASTADPTCRAVRAPGPRRRGRGALAGNPRCARYPAAPQRARQADRQLRRTVHRLGQRDDRSPRSDSPLRKARLRSGCARLGSRPPPRGPGSRPRRGRSGARAAGRGGRPRHGSGTRAERVLRGGLPLRGRRSPAHPRRWSVRWGVDRPTLPAALIGRASSRSERSRAAGCRPAARAPDRPRSTADPTCRAVRAPGPRRRGRGALAGNPRCARYPDAAAAGKACRPTTPTDRSPPRATRRPKPAKR